MATAGGGSKIPGSTGGGSTTVNAICEAGMRPRWMSHATMRGDGARVESKEVVEVILQSRIQMLRHFLGIEEHAPSQSGICAMPTPLQSITNFPTKPPIRS